MEKIEEKILERMGRLFEGFGVNPIMGRIFGLLFVSEEVLTLHTIAKTLQLSKAAISIQIRLLEDLGYCEKLPRTKDRQHYYRLREDYLEAVYTRRLEKEKQSLRGFQVLLRDHGVAADTASRRLREFLDFSHTLIGIQEKALLSYVTAEY